MKPKTKLCKPNYYFPYVKRITLKLELGELKSAVSNLKVEDYLLDFELSW